MEKKDDLKSDFSVGQRSGSPQSDKKLADHVKLVFDRRGLTEPEVTFIVPVFNEKNNVVALLDRLLSLPLSKEIVVVDDGSKDGTRALLEGYVAEGMGLWFHNKNLGKGAAVQTGLSVSSGQYVAIQDADLEYDPFQYVSLLTAIKKDKVDVVFGSRFITKNPSIYIRYYLGNKVLTWFINLMCLVHMTDTYTCFKLMKLENWSKLGLVSRGFEMEAEIAVKVALRRYSFFDVSIDYRPRSILEGKKIGWRDALKGIRAVVRFWRQEMAGRFR